MRMPGFRKKLYPFAICLCALSGVLYSQSSQTVNIGGNKWMTTNLDVVTFRNGDSIIHAQDYSAWCDADREKRPAWCWVDTTHPEFGRLYNGHTLSDYREVAQEGWSVASSRDWKGLDSVFQDSSRTVLALDSGYLRGNNRSGFSALPGGCRVVTRTNGDGQAASAADILVDYGTRWWTKEGDGVHMYAEADRILIEKASWKIELANGYYVRCVRTSNAK